MDNIEQQLTKEQYDITWKSYCDFLSNELELWKPIN